MPGYAVPQDFLLFDPLPRIASGKIDRRSVRDLIVARLHEQKTNIGASHGS
jgi:acyl-coenzyme A synthetase/AMP-(fatty) acid ligase